MKDIRKILVALDGSKNSARGLTKAIEMAKISNSKIIGINVVELPMSYFLSRPKMKIKRIIIPFDKFLKIKFGE